jgi:hypothetical protein
LPPDLIGAYVFGDYSPHAIEPAALAAIDKRRFELANPNVLIVR